MSVTPLNSKKKVPAAPPTFVLRMRLMSTADKPFADKPYELEWGKKKITGKTDADGKLEQKLDAKITSGILDLGEPDDSGTFVARITIPISIATPPEPFKPKQPPPKSKKKKDPPPPEKPPPLLLPPTSDSPPSAWKEYNDRNREWDQYDRDLEKYEEDKKKGFPEQDDAPPDFEPEGRPVQPRPKGGKPQLTPKEKKELEDKLNTVRKQYHDKAVRMYEIAYRLHNLGWLAGPFVPEFPLSGSFLVVTLLDAMQRYAQKFGFTRPYEWDITSPLELFDGLWRHIVTAHDGAPPP